MAIKTPQIFKIVNTILKEFAPKYSKYTKRRTESLIGFYEKENLNNDKLHSLKEKELLNILNRYKVIYKEAGNPVPSRCPECPIYDSCDIKDWVNADCREKIEQWIVTGEHPAIKNVPLDQNPIFMADLFYAQFIESILVIMDEENISEEGLQNRLGFDDDTMKDLFEEELFLTPQIIAEIGIALNRIPKVTFSQLGEKKLSKLDLIK